MANEENVEIGVSLDTSGVDSGIKEIVQSLTKIETKAKEATGNLTSFNESLKSMKTASESMVRASQDMASGLNSTLKSMAGLDKETNAMVAHQRALTDALQAQQRAMNTMSNQTDKLHAAYKQARDELTAMTKANQGYQAIFKAIGESVGTLRTQLQGLKGAGKISAQEFTELNRSIGGIAGSLREAGKIGKVFDGARDDLSKSLSSMGRIIRDQRGAFGKAWDSFLNIDKAVDAQGSTLGRLVDKLKSGFTQLTNAAVRGNASVGLSKSFDDQIGAIQTGAEKVIRVMDTTTSKIGKAREDGLKKIANASKKQASTPTLSNDEVLKWVDSAIRSGATSVSQIVGAAPRRGQLSNDFAERMKQDEEYNRNLKAYTENTTRALKAIALSADANDGLRNEAVGKLRKMFESGPTSSAFAAEAKTGAAKATANANEIDKAMREAMKASERATKLMNKWKPEKNVQGFFSPIDLPGMPKWSKEDLGKAYAKARSTDQSRMAFDVGAQFGIPIDTMEKAIANGISSVAKFEAKKAELNAGVNNMLQGMGDAITTAFNTSKKDLTRSYQANGRNGREVGAMYTESFTRGLMSSLSAGFNGGGGGGGISGTGGPLGDGPRKMVNRVGDGFISAFKSFGSGGKMASIMASASTIPQGIMDGIFKLNFHVFLAQQLTRTLTDAFKFAVRGIEIEDAMSELSEKLSLPVEGLNAFREAAVQTNTSMSDIQTMTKNFTVALDRINVSGINQFGLAFENLGLTIDEVKTQLEAGDTQAVFTKLLENIGNADPSAALAANVNKIFGRGGYKLIPIAKILAESRTEIDKELKFTGRYIDSLSAELGKKNQNLMLSLFKVPEGVREQITQGFDPGLQLALQKARVAIFDLDIGGGFLKDTVGVQLGEFFNAVVDRFSAESTRLRGRIQEIGMGDALLEEVSRVASGLASSLTTLFGRGLPIAFEVLVNGFTGAFEGVRKAIRENLTSIQSEFLGAAVGAKIGAAFGNPIAGAVIGAGAALVEKLGLDGAALKIQEQLDTINNAVSNFSVKIDLTKIATVGIHLAGILGGVGKIVGTVMNDLFSNALGNLGDVVGQALSGMASASRSFAASAFTAIANEWSSMVDTVIGGTMRTTFGSIGSDAAASMTQSINASISGIGKSIAGSGFSITALANSLASGLANLAQSGLIAAAVGSVGLAIASKLSAGIGGAFSTVGATKMGTALGGMLQNSVGAGLIQAEAQGAMVGSALIGGMLAIIAGVSILNFILPAASDTSKALASGKSIGEAILTGLVSAFSNSSSGAAATTALVAIFAGAGGPVTLALSAVAASTSYIFNAAREARRKELQSQSEDITKFEKYSKLFVQYAFPEVGAFVGGSVGLGYDGRQLGKQAADLVLGSGPDGTAISEEETRAKAEERAQISINTDKEIIKLRVEEYRKALFEAGNDIATINSEANRRELELLVDADRNELQARQASLQNLTQQLAAANKAKADAYASGDPKAQDRADASLAKLISQIASESNAVDQMTEKLKVASLAGSEAMAEVQNSISNSINSLSSGIGFSAVFDKLYGANFEATSREKFDELKKALGPENYIKVVQDIQKLQNEQPDLEITRDLVLRIKTKVDLEQADKSISEAQLNADISNENASVTRQGTSIFTNAISGGANLQQAQRELAEFEEISSKTKAIRDTITAAERGASIATDQKEIDAYAKIVEEATRAENELTDSLRKEIAARNDRADKLAAEGLRKEISNIEESIRYNKMYQDGLLNELELKQKLAGVGEDDKTLKNLREQLAREQDLADKEAERSNARKAMITEGIALQKTTDLINAAYGLNDEPGDLTPGLGDIASYEDLANMLDRVRHTIAEIRSSGPDTPIDIINIKFDAKKIAEMTAASDQMLQHLSDTKRKMEEDKKVQGVFESAFYGEGKSFSEAQREAQNFREILSATGDDVRKLHEIQTAASALSEAGNEAEAEKYRNMAAILELQINQKTELIKLDQQQLDLIRRNQEVAQLQDEGNVLDAQLEFQAEFNSGLITELELKEKIAALQYRDNPAAAQEAANNERRRAFLEQMQKGVIDLGQTINSSFEQIFDNIIDGGKDLGNTLKDIGKQWGRQIFSATLESKLGFDNKVKANFLDLGSFGKSVFGGLFKYVFGTNLSAGGSSGSLVQQAINTVTGGGVGGTGSPTINVGGESPGATPSGRTSSTGFLNDIYNQIFGQGAGSGSIIPLLLSGIGGAATSGIYGTNPLFGSGANLGVQAITTMLGMISGPTRFGLSALFNSPFTSLLANANGGISGFAGGLAPTAGPIGFTAPAPISLDAIGSAAMPDGSAGLLLSDGSVVADQAGGTLSGMGPGGSLAGSLGGAVVTAIAAYLGQLAGKHGAQAMVGKPQSLAEGVSGQMGGTIGAAAGAIGGAIAGSVIPVIGTLVGAAVGALAGGMAGSAGGGIGAASRMREPGVEYLSTNSAYGYGIADSIQNLPNDILALGPATLAKLTGMDFEMLNWMINPIGAMGTIMLKPLNAWLAQIFRPPTHGTILRRAGESALDSLPTFSNKDGGLQDVLGDISRSNYRGTDEDFLRAINGEDVTVGMPGTKFDKKKGMWVPSVDKIKTGQRVGGLTEEGLTAIRGFSTLFSGTMFAGGDIDSERLKGNEVSVQAAAWNNILTSFFGRLRGQPLENKKQVMQSLSQAMKDMGMDTETVFRQMNVTAESYFNFLDDNSMKFGGGEGGMFGSATGIKNFGESIRGLSEIMEADLPAGVHVASIAMRSLEKDGIKVFDNMNASQKDFLVEFSKNPEQFDSWMGMMAKNGARFDPKEIANRVKDISASSSAIAEAIPSMFDADNIDAGLGAFGKKMKDTLISKFKEVSIKQLFDKTAIGEGYESAFKVLRQADEGAFDLTKTSGVQEFSRRLIEGIKQGRMALAEYAPQLEAIRKAAADAAKINTEEDFNAEVAARTVAIEDNLRSSVGSAIQAGIQAGGGENGMAAFKTAFRSAVNQSLTGSVVEAFTKGAILNSTLAPLQAKMETMIQQAFQNGVADPAMIEKIKALSKEIGKALNAQLAQLEPLAEQVFSLVTEGVDETKKRVAEINVGLRTGVDNAIKAFTQVLINNFDNRKTEGFEKGNAEQAFVNSLYGDVRSSMVNAVVQAFTNTAIIQGSLAPALDSFGQHAKDFFKDGKLSDTEKETLRSDLSMVRTVLGETFQFLRPLLQQLGLTVDQINELTEPPDLKKDAKGKIVYRDGDIHRGPPAELKGTAEYAAWVAFSDEQRGFMAQIMSEGNLSYKEAIADVQLFSQSLSTVGYDVNSALKGIADSAKDQGISFKEARDNFTKNQNELYKYSDFNKIIGVTAKDVTMKGGPMLNMAQNFAESQGRSVINDADAERANRLDASLKKYEISIDEGSDRIKEIMHDKGLNLTDATDYFIASLLSGGEEARIAARRNTEATQAIDAANQAQMEQTNARRLEVVNSFDQATAQQKLALDTASNEWVNAMRARGADEATIRSELAQIRAASGNDAADATNRLTSSTTRLETGASVAEAGLDDAGDSAGSAADSMDKLKLSAFAAAEALSNIKIKVNVDINGVTGTVEQNTSPVSNPGGSGRVVFNNPGSGGRGTPGLATGGYSTDSAVVGEGGKPELVQALPGGGFHVTPLEWHQASSLMKDGTAAFAKGGGCASGRCGGGIGGCAGGCGKKVRGFAFGGCVGEDCGNGNGVGIPGMEDGGEGQAPNARQRMNNRDAEDALYVGVPKPGVRKGKYESCAQKIEFEKLEGYDCCAAGSNLDGTTKCMNKLTWGNTSGCQGSACAGGGGMRYTDGWKLAKTASCSDVNPAQHCIGADPNPFQARNGSSNMNGRYWVKVLKPFNGSFTKDKSTEDETPAMFASVVSSAFSKAASDVFGLSPGGYKSEAERKKEEEAKKTKGAYKGGYIDPMSSAVVGEAGMPELVTALPGGGFRVQPLSWDQADRMLQGGLPGFAEGTPSHGGPATSLPGLFSGGTGGAEAFGEKIGQAMADGFKNSLAGALQKAFEESAVVKGAEEAIDNLMKDVEKAAAAALKGNPADAAAAEQAIDDALAAAEEQLKKIEDQAKILAPLMAKLALKKALEVNINMSDPVKEYLKGGSATDLENAFKESVFNSVLNGMVEAMLVSGPLKDAIDLMNQAISDTMKGVMDGSIDPEEATARLKNIADSGGAIIRNQLDLMKPFIEGLGGALGIGVASNADIVKNTIGDSIKEALTTKDGMKHFAKNAKTAVFHAIRDGLINAFIQGAVINGLLGPIMKRITEAFENVGKEVTINGQKVIMTLTMASEIALRGAEEARRLLEDPAFLESMKSISKIAEDIAASLGVSAYDTEQATDSLTDSTNQLTEDVANSCAGQCDVEKKLYVAELGLGQLTQLGRPGSIRSEIFYPRDNPVTNPNPTTPAPDKNQPQQAWMTKEQWEEKYPDRPMPVCHAVMGSGTADDPEKCLVNIPKFGEGGRITKPTLLVAGERGTEYIMNEDQMAKAGGGDAETKALLRELITKIDQQEIRVTVMMDSIKLGEAVRKADREARKTGRSVVGR